MTWFINSDSLFLSLCTYRTRLRPSLPLPRSLQFVGGLVVTTRFLQVRISVLTSVLLVHKMSESFLHDLSALVILWVVNYYNGMYSIQSWSLDDIGLSVADADIYRAGWPIYNAHITGNFYLIKFNNLIMITNEKQNW